MGGCGSLGGAQPAENLEKSQILYPDPISQILSRGSGKTPLNRSMVELRITELVLASIAQFRPSDGGDVDENGCFIQGKCVLR